MTTATTPATTIITVETADLLPQHRRGFGHIPVLRALDMLKDDGKAAPDKVWVWKGMVFCEKEAK